jgi:hypothetical protein
LLGNGDGTFQAAQNYAADNRPVSVAVGDFNGDGISDLAVANSWGTMSILLGNGDGSFRTAQIYAVGSAPISVAVGDLNGDHYPDLVIANEFAAGTVTVLLNAADWGGGPAPVPPSRPGLHRPVPNQAHIKLIAAFLAVSQAQAEHPLAQTFPDLLPSPARQWPLEMETGQSANLEAIFSPRSMVTARHAQDTVFQGWGDGLLDNLAWNLSR